MRRLNLLNGGMLKRQRWRRRWLRLMVPFRPARIRIRMEEQEEEEEEGGRRNPLEEDRRIAVEEVGSLLRKSYRVPHRHRSTPTLSCLSERLREVRMEEVVLFKTKEEGEEEGEGVEEGIEAREEEEERLLHRKHRSIVVKILSHLHLSQRTNGQCVERERQKTDIADTKAEREDRMRKEKDQKTKTQTKRLRREEKLQK